MSLLRVKMLLCSITILVPETIPSELCTHVGARVTDGWNISGKFPKTFHGKLNRGILEIFSLTSNRHIETLLQKYQVNDFLMNRTLQFVVIYKV